MTRVSPQIRTLPAVRSVLVWCRGGFTPPCGEVNSPLRIVWNPRVNRMKDSKNTPSSVGFSMPAEWERHEATWLAWPHNPEDWPGKFQAIPWLYAEIVRLLAVREQVHILVEDAKAELRVFGILERAGANLGRVSLHTWPTNRSWTRDSGPIFVRNN